MITDATRNVRKGVKLVPNKVFRYPTIAVTCSLSVNAHQLIPRRSACLSRGDVDHVDVAKTLIYLRDTVGVRTLIDFRYCISTQLSAEVISLTIDIS